MARFVSESPRETQRIAKNILQRFAAKSIRPLIFALMGELGSGKTTFVQGLARALGVREKVQSPTFVLVKWYQTPKHIHQFHHFIHVDAYRLDSPAEARHLGLKGMLKDRDAVAVIEWASRLKKLLPRRTVWVSFSHGKAPNERIIKISE